MTTILKPRCARAIDPTNLDSQCKKDATGIIVIDLFPRDSPVGQRYSYITMSLHLCDEHGAEFVDNTTYEHMRTGFEPTIEALRAGGIDIDTERCVIRHVPYKSEEYLQHALTAMANNTPAPQLNDQTVH